ncbi:MAG: hypothetical protein ACTHNU_05950 [Gaiellales bacterium]
MSGDEWQRDLAEARNTERRLDAEDDVATDEVQSAVEVARELYLDLADEEYHRGLAPGAWPRFQSGQPVPTSRWPPAAPPAAPSADG